MIEYFNKLSVEEVRLFKKFVISPYHNSNIQIAKLFKYLYSKYPDDCSANLNKKTVFRYIYRGKKYNELLYRKLISDYNLLFEKFLIQKTFESNSYAKSNYLLSALKNLNNVNRFNHHYKIINRTQNKVIKEDFDYYLSNYLIEKSNYELTFFNMTRSSLLRLEKFINGTDLLIIYVKMLAIEVHQALNAAIPPQKIIPNNFNEEIFQYVEIHLDEMKKNHPGIYFMYAYIKYMQTYDDKYFYEFEEYFKRKWSKTKGRLFSDYLNFYYTFYLNKFYSTEGNIMNFKLKLFQYYDKYYVKKDSTIILQEDFINNSTFLVGVKVGCSLNKFKWTDNYIERCKVLIFPGVYNDTYNFSKALLFFYSKKYQISLEFLGNISNSISGLGVNAKVLKLIIFYELGEQSGIVYLITSLDNLNKKKNFSDELLKPLKVFLYYYKKITSYKFENIRNKNSEIKLTIVQFKKEEKDLLHKNWLYEKLKELQKITFKD